MMRFILLCLLSTLAFAEAFSDRVARLDLARSLIDSEVAMREKALADIAENLSRLGNAITVNPQNLAVRDNIGKNEARRVLVQEELKGWKASKAKVDADWAALVNEVLAPYRPAIIAEKAP